MKDIITDFLKRQGIKVILTQKLFTGAVDVFYINYLGADDYYYSLLVAYNDTQFLLSPGANAGTGEVKNLTGKIDDFEEEEESAAESAAESTSNNADMILRDNLRRFSTKADLGTGCWSIDLAQNFSAMLMENLKSYCIGGKTLGDYAVISHKLWTRPSLGFSILYSKNGIYGGTINIWLGCKTLLDYNAELYEFCDLLQINNFIEWRYNNGINDRGLEQIY